MDWSSDSSVVNPAGRRGKPRLRLNLPGQLGLVSGRLNCVVDDISQSGARVALENQLTPGASIMLHLLGIEAFGMLVWTTPVHCGMQFDEMLPYSTLVTLRARLDHWKHDELQNRRLSARAWAQGGLGG